MVGEPGGGRGVHPVGRWAGSQAADDDIERKRHLGREPVQLRGDPPTPRAHGIAQVDEAQAIHPSSVGGCVQQGARAYTAHYN